MTQTTGRERRACNEGTVLLAVTLLGEVRTADRLVLATSIGATALQPLMKLLPDNPEYFATLDLLPYQRAFAANPARFKIALWARQTGKDYTATAAKNYDQR